MVQTQPFRDFESARVFVRNLKLKGNREWREYLKSGKKPNDIPASPYAVYKNKWKGYSDWLGNFESRSSYREMLPFEEARSFVRKLNLKTGDEWEIYRKSGKKPTNIPSSPREKYRGKWKGYEDWLGTLSGSKYGKYRDFNDAREFVKSLKLEGVYGWFDYCKSGKKPADIPAHPDKVYNDKWKGYTNWTGYDRRKNKFRELRSFEDARSFVRSLGLKNYDGWIEYKKSGKKPADIPATPQLVYKDKWKGLGDWLGTNILRPKDRKFRSFEDARSFVRKLGLKNTFEWYDWRKSKSKPLDIPSCPERLYKDKWKGLGDWLGTFSVAKQKRSYRTFEESRKFIHSLGLKNWAEWLEYCKSGKKPLDIPLNPNIIYKDQFVDIHDWLGVESSVWSVNRIKTLLQDMIKSGVIYQWDEAVLYSFLLRKGLLNLGEGNRHDNFFKNLLKAIKTPAGREAIGDYANSDYETPPDFKPLIAVNENFDPESEIKTASSEEISELLDDSDPLQYEDIIPVDKVLKQTDFLESINVDEEAIRFYVNYSINQLWKNAFQDEQKTVESVKQEGTNGNKYHDEVIETFLTDYSGATNLEIPKGYSFPQQPLLMQKYVAYKIKQNSYFGNFSGTGAGKTLSAVLASKVIDSKLTLIVCPNDVVEHWENHIIEIFPDSEIISGKEAFYVDHDPTKHRYAILNYDKFNQLDSPNLILILGNRKIDFVVLDEIHFSKIRDANISLRRMNLDGLMTEIRNKNPKVKVLGISATPVVNNLFEGRSLLELITGKIYDDVATRPTIPNAVTLYEKLSNISIREMPDYPIQLLTNYIEVETEKPSTVTIKNLKSNPLVIEQILTDARIPEIVKLIEGQTIIYTEYVEKIISKISNAVRDAGYSFALYTGSDHSGRKRFVQKKVQVLIASRPISTGIDGLQKICNRLIINTLPWTNALYQQLLGRLVRRGQIKDVVQVYIVKASIGGYPYDQLKLNRIKFKKTLADCAVDGILPEKNLVTPAQAMLEAVKWLERLEKGQISSVTRGDLNVKLNPVQIEQRIKKFGDFERLNNKFNTEKSETTHLRLLENPEEWLEYHRQYREARKSWDVIPYGIWIERLNKLSPRLIIGDFGCGEAKIREAIGNRIHSFDHVAISNEVTPCDMKSIPLDDGGLDVVIFSLSLMGKNWNDYIKEAKRCLATNGYLLISETTNAFKGRLKILRHVLIENEFEIYDDYENGQFTFLEARKT